MAKAKLTKKERGFVTDYVLTENGTQSVLKHYDTQSPKVASVIAVENLAKPRIQEAIAEKKKTIGEYFPDEEIVEIHRTLLKSSSLDHMTFPLGPKTEEERQQRVALDIAKATTEGREYREVEYITDQDVIDLLESTNCVVRRIVHRETARDVYFWSPDNMARDKALDKIYKIKGNYAPEKSITLNIDVEASQEVTNAANILNALYGGSGGTGNGALPDSMGSEAQDKE